MITRIHKLIDKEGISIRRFEQSINASNGLIRKAIANHTDVQSKWILEIADTYPNLNLDWLIKGEGEMYRENSSADATRDRHLIEIYELNELRSKIEALSVLVQTKEDVIKAQMETIQSKNEMLEFKDKIIASLTENK